MSCYYILAKFGPAKDSFAALLNCSLRRSYWRNLPAACLPPTTTTTAAKNEKPY